MQKVIDRMVAANLVAPGETPAGDGQAPAANPEPCPESSGVAGSDHYLVSSYGQRS
jgi:hypothetical protein